MGMDNCPICGKAGVVQGQVLWPELIEAWNLTPDETGRIDRQQGECCLNCGANLRSRTLASALLQSLDWRGPVVNDQKRFRSSRLKVLEINPAASLTPYLSWFPHHRLIEYPKFDMQALSVDSDSCDVVIHSDTLEHVQDPVKGLSECRRILKPRGCLLTTIPIVPSKFTRRRTGMPASYHGNEQERSVGFEVVTEYGADFYMDFFSAGWTRLSLYTLGTPDSIAIAGIK
jgi:SAM-dependent methyltransferase